MAWLGAALSAPLVVYSASPFPEVSGAFFATLAATLLGRVPGSVVRRFGAAVCLGAMVATKNRFAVLIPAFAPAFAGRLTRRGLVLGALGGAAGIALVVA